MKYQIDRSLQDLPGGRQVMGGSPLKIFTLTSGGQRMLQRLRAGEDLGRNVLIDRLELGGAIHPTPTDGPYSRDDVTVVVPAYGAVRIADFGPRLIVVDDASPAGRPDVPAHATVLRRETNGGPGAARMTGLAAVTTALVAFVDVDVTVDEGWLEGLLPHFVDERVALIAPRVRASPGSTVFATFEQVRSPLDLGDEPASVRARTRVSYVPSAAIVVRVDALRSIGGFDDALRTGEDVDMVWRLVRGGYIARYEPSIVVHHDVRPDLRAWLKQRSGYGQSAGPLARRHPGALAPLGVSGWSAAVWALIGFGQPVAAVAVAAGTAAALTKKLPNLPRRTALNLVRFGHLGAGKQIAAAITRTWWPIAVVAALFSKRARRILLVSAVVPALLDWRSERPALHPVRYLALRILDDGSYGFGVWKGAWLARTVEPLVPDLTSWPRPSRFERRSGAR